MLASFLNMPVCIDTTGPLSLTLWKLPDATSTKLAGFVSTSAKTISGLEEGSNYVRSQLQRHIPTLRMTERNFQCHGPKSLKFLGLWLTQQEANDFYTATQK